jgi:hypothetical protein
MAHYIAGLQKTLRLHENAHAGRGTGGYQVNRLKCKGSREIFPLDADGMHHFASVTVLSQFTIDPRLKRQLSTQIDYV